jgi:hypothetical protein
MKELGIDPRDYTYHSSDEDSTTLQHKKGHQLKIAHNVLSKKNQSILKALANTPTQDDSSGKDIQPYGKVIQKADGGYVKEIHSDKSEPGYTKMAGGGNVNLPCLNPNCKSMGKPHPNCRCYGLAEGGKITSHCDSKTPHKRGCHLYMDGGAVSDQSDRYLVQDNEIATPNSYIPGVQVQDKTTPAQDAAREQARAEEDVEWRKQNETQETPEDNSGYTTYAKGGTVPSKSPSMMSCSKPFAEGGSADPEISMAEALKVVIPWIQEQMKSKDKDRKAYAAPEGPVSKDDPAPTLPAHTEIEDLPDEPESEGMSSGPATPPATSEDSGQAGGMSTGDATPPDTGISDQQGATSAGPATPPTAQPRPTPPVKKVPGQAVPQVSQNITPAQYKDSVQNNIMDEARAWSKDLDDGHIQPETYQSLFDKKDTLGKIGTLFGLMLSGAGSGLAHQPNMLMEMMNKQISNDLDAQKTTSANRQNYVRLAQQHELNKANILTQAAGRKLTAAETGQINQLVDLKSKMFAQRGAMAAQMAKVNAMPEGPDKQRAMNAAAMMYKTLDAENSDTASRFATAQALTHFGDAGSPQGNESAYQQNQNMLRRSGNTDWADQNDQRHIPGISGSASRPVPEDVRTRVVAMNTLDNQMNNLMNAVNQYKTFSLKGNLDPRITGPMAVKAHEAAALYNQTLDGLGMTQGRMDWLDKQIPSNPQKFMEKLQGSMQKLQEVSKNNKMRRDMILSGPGGLGYPKQNINTNLSGQDNQVQPQQSNVGGTSKSGRPIEYRNGKVFYVK